MRLLCLLLACGAWACSGNAPEDQYHLTGGEEEEGVPRLSPLELLFASRMNRTSARANLQFLTAKPHQAGTRQDKVLADFMVSQFTKFGMDRAWVDPIPASVSYPERSPRVAVLARGSGRIEVELKLSEDLLDSFSDVWDRNHTSLGYSPSGNVTGKLVYANFGTPQDFAVLARLGVPIKGNIVLVRYGRCFRGLKVKNAQELGAVGVLIYSDPMEDGYAVGPDYPNGPWRPQSSVQRGSVVFNSLCAGDPDRKASNKEGATLKVCGYSPSELVPRIPALPLAWEDALPLLRKLQFGPWPPSDFVGALANLTTYQLGPSPQLVWMQVSNVKLTKPIWNAFGLIKGRDYGTARDRPVILGNHRDAWVFGAVDPNSGTAVMLEVAKAFAVLPARPRRTVLFASWSGEELGLLGSTAFGENNAEFLQNAVAYVNVDVGVSGKLFQLGCTATLARLVRQVMAALPDPELLGESLLVRWPNNNSYSQLGTGSDYTVFVHHRGIASVDMRFSPARGNGGSATQYGVYHSDFDSFDWMDRQGDPGFVFHEQMAKVFGLVALRLANNPVLPFSHVDQARLVVGFVDRIRGMVPCPRAFRDMQRAAKEYLAVAQSLIRDEASNDKMAFSERQFLAKQGLPLRQWFKHVLHAPGLHLGYDADFLPGITQAYRDMHDPKLAIQQALLFTERLRAVSRSLK